jgi:hypothetical protein
MALSPKELETDREARAPAAKGEFSGAQLDAALSPKELETRKPEHR